jgi:hypothetical protein
MSSASLSNEITRPDSRQVANARGPAWILAVTALQGCDMGPASSPEPRPPGPRAESPTPANTPSPAHRPRASARRRRGRHAPGPSGTPLDRGPDGTPQAPGSSRVRSTRPTGRDQPRGQAGGGAEEPRPRGHGWPGQVSAWSLGGPTQPDHRARPARHEPVWGSPWIRRCLHEGGPALRKMFLRQPSIRFSILL